MSTLWQTVDEPMLRWLASLPAKDVFNLLLSLGTREPETFTHVDGITSIDARDSLRRLVSHGLISGREKESIGGSVWYRLRVAANGLIVLGEWPDLDRVASAASLHRLLVALADEAPDQEKKGLRRAAGSIGNLGDGIVHDTVAEIAHEIGGAD
jgi:hypothetical protein